MIKSFLALLISIVFVSDIRSQEHSANIDSIYHHWAKRGVIEATYAYMKDYAQRDKPLSQSEKDALNRYDVEFLKTNRAILDSDLDKISSFLENNSWPSTNRKIFKVLRKKYENNKPLEKSFFDLPRIDNTYSNWNEKVKEIVGGYAKNTSEATDSRIRVSKSKPRTSITDANNRNLDVQDSRWNANWVNYLLYIIMLLLGISIGVISVNRRLERRVFSILNYEDGINKRKYDPQLGLVKAVQILNKHKKDYAEDCSKFKKEIQKLNDKLKETENQKDEFHKENIELEKKIEENNIGVSIQQDIEREKTEEKSNLKATANQINKLFFSIPDIDGNFNNIHGQWSNDSKKYYKIEFEENSKSGLIEFMSSEKDKRAIKRNEVFLEPVCDIENPDEDDVATKIKVLKSGIVNFIDGKWVIDKDNKIKVRLC